MFKRCPCVNNDEEVNLFTHGLHTRRPPDIEGYEFERLKIFLSVKTCIESKSGASEVSRINGRGFNFDVAPSLVGIRCPLISRVGVSEVHGERVEHKGQVRRFRSIVGGSE